MRSIALLLTGTAGLVRNEKKEAAPAAIEIASAAAIEETVGSAGLVEAESSVEGIKLPGGSVVGFAPHCGMGVSAEYDCVKACLMDEDCSKQPEIRAALALIPQFKVEQEGDGWVFGEGSICVRPSAGKSWCKRGNHDAVACHRGVCTAYDDDRPCDEDSTSQKCNIRQLQKGNSQDLATLCFEDRTCRRQLLVKGGEEFMKALKLTCLFSSDSGWGNKRCFYSPTQACVDTCRDGLACNDGRCPEEIGNRVAWYVPKEDGDLEERTMGESANNFGNTLIGRGGTEGAYCQANRQSGQCTTKDMCPGMNRIGGTTDGCARGYVCCAEVAKKCYANDQPGTCQDKDRCPDHFQTGGRLDGCPWGTTCCGEEPKKCKGGRGACKPEHSCRNDIGGWFDGCAKGTTCCAD